MTRQHHDAMEAAKGELQEQLESASSYIVQLEEKFYNSQTTQLDMLKQLKDTEFEVENKEGEITADESIKMGVSALASRQLHGF